MCHPFFDELRVEGARMPNGKDFPLLFNFTREGAFCVICARSRTTKADVRAAVCPLNRAFRTSGSHPHARTAPLRARPGSALDSFGQLRADTIGADEDPPGLNARQRSMAQAGRMSERPVCSCFYLTIFCCCSTSWLDLYLFSLSLFLLPLILVLRLMLRVALGPPHCRGYVLNPNCLIRSVPTSGCIHVNDVHCQSQECRLHMSGVVCYGYMCHESVRRHRECSRSPLQTLR